MSEKKCATVSLEASGVAHNNENYGSSAASHQQGTLATGADTVGLMYLPEIDINGEYYVIVSATNPPGAARPVISRQIYERRSGRLVDCVKQINSPSVDVEVV